MAIQRNLHLKHILLAGMTLLVGGTLAITGYLMHAKHGDDVSTGLEIAALNSKNLEEFVTQSLRVSELAAANALQTNALASAPGRLDLALQASLRHAPFLRSISLLDSQGRITASSNPANTGLHIPIDSFFPPVKEMRDGLGIGKPWTGRDFATGSIMEATGATDVNSPRFVPVLRHLGTDPTRSTWVFTLNPDYFVDHMVNSLATDEGRANILRYDGTLLMGSDPAFKVGSMPDDLMRGLNLAESESGRFEQSLAPSQRVLTAFKASGLYPFVVVTHIQRDHALRHWHSTVKALLSFGVPALFALALLTRVLYRHQTQLDAQRAESNRLQRINASVFDSSTEAILITDTDDRVISVNTAFTEVTGFQASDIVGRSLNECLTAEAVNALRHAKEPFAPIEAQLQCKNGLLLWNEILATPAYDGDGKFTGYQHICRNINGRKLAEDKLRLAADVFQHTREGIMFTDADNRIVDVNDAFIRITGYSREEVMGKNPSLLSSNRHDKAYFHAIWRTLSEKGHVNGEFWNRHKNGDDYAVLMNISTVRDTQGAVKQYVALFSDITGIKEHQQQLEHIAHFDALTGLPNRVLLSDRLKQAMAQAQRRSQRLAVAFMDLDGFKAVNDQHGHEAGDQLLIALGHRMRHALRDGDTLARLGGDEFVVVLSDLDSLETSVPILTRLLAAAARPVQFGEANLQVSGSLGVTFFPQTEEVDADQLLRQADQAMYQAKLAGKNRYHLFDAEQDKSVRGHHESVARIRQALESGELVLHYQPKVNMRTGTVVGAEALIRWQHPDRGLLLPAAFLPVIEDHAIALDIGKWVINTALTQVSVWQTEGLLLPVSVNVGARQLQHAGFAADVRELLDAHPAVPPESLAIEVLETSALEDISGVSTLMEDCHQMGVDFALDDFGTGYSSLTYLKRLPVSQLKIDQSFVRDMLHDPDDLAIMRGVIDLAAVFQRQVIAEGVETVAQGVKLMQLGCDLAQGFCIAQPMPGSEMHTWAANWRPDPAWQTK